MEKLLLVLLMLGFVVPASADIFIYNYKEVDVGFDSWNEWEPNYCEQYKETWSAFFAVEPNNNDSTTDIWCVWTWTYKGGKGAEVDKIAEGMNTTVAQQSTKKIFQIVTSNDGADDIILYGQVKPRKIGLQSYNIASTMTGNWVWNDVNDHDMGTGRIKMSLNTRYTIMAKDNNWTTAEQAANGLLAYLEDVKGYNP